jgi:hypothetical protein
MPGPGRFIGQDVTIRHSIRPWAIAGAGKVLAATAPAAAVVAA